MTFVAAQFGLWRGARRAHPLTGGCNRRVTKPQAKFGATRRAAGLFRPDFVARSLQIHCGICSSLTPRLGEKSLAANVIVLMPQTTSKSAHVFGGLRRFKPSAAPALRPCRRRGGHIRWRSLAPAPPDGAHGTPVA